MHVSNGYVFNGYVLFLQKKAQRDTLPFPGLEVCKVLRQQLGDTVNTQLDLVGGAHDFPEPHLLEVLVHAEHDPGVLDGVDGNGQQHCSTLVQLRRLGHLIIVCPEQSLGLRRRECRRRGGEEEEEEDVTLKYANKIIYGNHLSKSTKKMQQIQKHVFFNRPTNIIRR